MISVYPFSRAVPPPAPPDLGSLAEMGRDTFPAMGTTVTVCVPAPQTRPAAAAIRALFQAWEGTLSRVEPSSELFCLNRCAAGQEVAVSGLLFHVAATAVAAAHVTGGIYDPTVLHERSSGSRPPPMAVQQGASTGGGWRQVTLDHARRRITLPPGVGLDLGGIARGMAVDAAVAYLRQVGIGAALVSAGGDLGVYGLPGAARGWPIEVPGKAEQRIVAE